MSRTRIYIVERDLFVSEDMKDGLHSILPSTECTVVDSISEARQAARGRGEPWAVVVTANVDGGFDASLDDLAWLAEKSVIAFDVRSPEHFPHWVHLRKPFTEDHLADAVRRIAATKPTRAAE